MRSWSKQARFAARLTYNLLGAIMATEKPIAEQAEEDPDEVTEFMPDEPHPDTPRSVLEEQGFEVREYSGDDDDQAHDETWKKLEKRRAEKKKWKTLVMPDPEAEGETLTVRYREIDPGSSVILQNVAIMTGVVYNLKHERLNDSLIKAEEEGRLEEYLQVLKNNEEHQYYTISLGVEKPIEEVKEIFSHPIVRARLANAVKGGAVPRLSTDEPTDIDIFPEQVEGQASGETVHTD